MAGKPGDKSEGYEYYHDVFNQMRKSVKGTLSGTVWVAVEKDDQENPATHKAEKWELELKDASTAYCLYHFMFTPEQVQRRIKAAIKYEQTACEKLQHKGSLKSFRPVWSAMSSSILKGGYDSTDLFSDCVMAAAIWILDEFSLNRKLDELYPFIVDACEYNCSDFLSYAHPSYDPELISAVINTIRHRNDDLYKHDSYRHSVFIKPFVLTGVLRNYIASGANDIPGESSFAELDSKSRKFRKLHAEAV